MRVLTRCLLTTSAIACAFPSPAADEPYGLSGSASIFTQYVFRGLTQTGRKPALHGNLEFLHETGFYIGGAAHNVSWVSDVAQSQGSGIVSVSLKLELSLGHKARFGDWSYDVGYQRYQFPGSYPSGFVKPHTHEIYGQVGWKGITLKLSDSLGNKTFGIENSKRSLYADLTAAIPLTDFLTLTLHAGKTKVKGENGGVSNNVFSYNDYKVELWMAFDKDWTGGLGFTTTNTKDNVYRALDKDLGDKQFYGFVKRSF